MSEKIEAVKNEIKAYIVEEFLPGEAPEALTDETELITHGVLDSLTILQLVSHLEKNYSVSIAANEVNKTNMNLLPDLASLVVSKQG